MTEAVLPPLPADFPSQPYRAAAIIGKKPLHFTFTPDAPARAAICAHLGLLDLPELRLKGSFTPRGRGDVVLKADLQAQVVQACTITLAPVPALLTSTIARDYLHDFAENQAQEVELGPEDTDPIPEFFDVAALAVEELALCLPLYPRSDGAHLGAVQAAPAGAAPLSDDKLRPFAGLAGLAAKMGLDPLSQSEGQPDPAPPHPDAQNKGEIPK